MRAGIYDPLANGAGEEDDDCRSDGPKTRLEGEERRAGREPEKPMIEFLRPSEIAAYIRQKITSLSATP